MAFVCLNWSAHSNQDYATNLCVEKRKFKVHTCWSWRRFSRSSSSISCWTKQINKFSWHQHGKNRRKKMSAKLRLTWSAKICLCDWPNSSSLCACCRARSWNAHNCKLKIVKCLIPVVNHFIKLLLIRASFITWMSYREKKWVQH